MDNIYNLFKIEDVNNVTGLTDELNALYINNFFIKSNKNIIVLTSSLFEATKYYEKLKTYTDNVYFFPMDEFLTSVALAVSPELKNRRLETLNSINDKTPAIVVTNLMGFLRYLPSKNVINKSVLKFKLNEEINRTNLENLLEEFGYNRTSLVTSTGEYSVRGFVIDIFPIQSEKPIRLEFFGKVIDKIKFFDEDTQLSTDDLNEYSLYPYIEILSTQKESLYEFLDSPVVFNIEKEIINNSYKQLKEEIFEYNDKNQSKEEHMFNLEDFNIEKEINIGDFGSITNKDFRFHSEEIESFKGDLNLVKDFVLSKLPKYTVVFMTTNRKFQNELSELFSHQINIGSILNNKINILNQDINKGFIINKTIYISTNDVGGREKKNKYKSSFKIGRKIKTFSDIKKGDYVVHIHNGIGVYEGVMTLNSQGFNKDYIQINYAGNDKVYVPVEKISTIYKYSDGEGVRPKINSLGTSTWAKTKQAVRKKIKDISEDLMKLYAQRAKSKTIPYKTFIEEEKFAYDFEHTETADQIKTISEIDKDLSSVIPMDRLLCGDVGFGKTEVAFRGMFKTVLNGHQVAYLCPTTILSNQHYKSALERFSSHAINIELLNRFTTPKQTERIMKGLKEGTIDIVIGTHKLLNNLIEFKNLGLLVVDEEQRFGVTHKEKIKTIKNDVNVLTLSATPIPRTLKMAMSGLRDLSIIDTAPMDRYPIQTYVIEENDFLVKDAIYKELSREGQVYLLYNNVKDIENRVRKIQLLVPDARVNFAHGQMSKQELESRIEDFVNHEFDVLVCSTIIETGMDITNTNTLIVVDAQNFGLSQLYQLRGRVGRGNRVAYAYLMYNPAKTLTETAIKRLNAIKEFTELGSGYKIALRDLSIRGAGDLLGSEQAGFIDSVGIDLYTKMVNEVMQEIKGEAKIIEDTDSKSLINVDTHISEDYVSDENVRIEIHNLINQIEDENSLLKIKSEIEDRFGKVDEKIVIYMYEEWFEKLTLELGINRVRQTKSEIEITLPVEISNQIDGDKLFLQTYNIHPKFRLKYQMKRISITLPLVNLNKHHIYYLIDLLNEIKSHI